MIRPLTSLRVFAALLVYANHTDVSAPWHHWADSHRLGAAGVAFFFVLSGFILTYSHRADFATGITWDATRAFWAARFARIFPLQYVTFFGMIIAAFVGIYTFSIPPGGCRTWCIGSQLTLTQAWSFWDWNVTSSFNAPAWTISDETFFYAVFPIAAWLILRRTRRPQIYLACAAGVFLLITVAQTIGQQWTQTWPFFYYLPPLRLPEFLVGMLVAAAFGSRARNAGAWANLLEPLALVAIAGVLVFAEPVPLGWLIPFAAFAIWTFASGGGWLSRLLTLGPFVYLGEISFAFYMVHHILVIGLPHNWLVLPYSLALSALLYHVAESPARRVLRSFLSAPRPVVRTA